MARATVEAFVDGINSYVDLCRDGDVDLPPDLAALDYLPARWSAHDVARIRAHGWFANAESEMTRAVTLDRHGSAAEALRQVSSGSVSLIADLDEMTSDALSMLRLATTPPQLGGPPSAPETPPESSNNWVISGRRTASGRPILASDPHRSLAMPSLRYVSHICTPEIDIIGAGEPFAPSVSLGHHGSVAFGLTILPINHQDLHIYDLSPDGTAYRC